MPWNGAWLIYCTVAMLLVPCAMGLALAAPIFTRVFPEQPDRVGLVLVAGLMFGCGAFLFGMCVDLLGVALSNAIVSGMVALVGSLGPIVTGMTQFNSRDWAALLLELVTLSAGIAATCAAALLRDRPDLQRQMAARGTAGALLGVSLALLAGCFSSMLNLGFVYGGPLRDSSIEAGVPEALASLSVWIPILAGAFAVNLLATNWRLMRAGEYSLMARAPLSDWLRAVAMGLLWISGIMAYGAGAPRLGSDGLVYAWAIVTGGSILVSTIWGVILGEWTGASSQASGWLVTGVVLMLVSLLVLSIRTAL